jgi:hypothetical protein
MDTVKDGEEKAKKEALSVGKTLDDMDRVKSDHGPYKETTTLQRETNEQYSSPGAHAIPGPGFSAVSLGSLDSSSAADEDDIERGRSGPPPPALILTATLVEDSRPLAPPFLPTVLASPPVLARAEPAERFETEHGSPEPDSVMNTTPSPKRTSRSRRTKCIIWVLICLAISTIAGLSVGLSIALRKSPEPPPPRPPNQDNDNSKDEEQLTEVNTFNSAETGTSENADDGGDNGKDGGSRDKGDDRGGSGGERGDDGGGGGKHDDARRLQKYPSID